jgi:hypothetical protein
VGVHGDAGHPERVAKDHIGGFPTNTWQGHQVLQLARHLPREALHKCRPQLEQGVGLSTEEAGGREQRLQLRTICGSVGRGVRIAGEQDRGDGVHPFVGGL